MPAIQAYDFVNDMIDNISYTGKHVANTADLVAFGESVLADPLLKESVYDYLYDRIGKTVIAIDTAPDPNERGILYEEYEYGAILQKLSFAMQDAEVASEWDIEHPQNPYELVRKEGIIAKYFTRKINAWAWTDVIYDRQLREAFINPQSLDGFTSALFTRMSNSRKLSEQALIDAAIGTLIAVIYTEATALTPGVNAARRVRHLLTEYNTAMGTSLTDTTSMQNANYLEYVRKQIEIDKKNLNRLTKLYNDGSVARRSTEGDLKLDLSVELTESYAKFYGDTYNDKYVQLPKHTPVVNWGIATDPRKVSINYTAQGEEAGTDVTVGKILGLMYDKDAVACTFQHQRNVSKVDEWNERVCTKAEAERSFMCDPSENAILYLND